MTEKKPAKPTVFPPFQHHSDYRSSSYHQGYNFTPYANQGAGNFSFGSGSGYDDGVEGSYQQVCSTLLCYMKEKEMILIMKNCF